MNKASKLELLKYYRNTERIAPIVYNEKTFDFDETSQSLLQIALIALEGTENTVEWITADDETVRLDAGDIKAIFVLAMIRNDELRKKYRILRDQVNEAQDENAINAVEW